MVEDIIEDLEIVGDAITEEDIKGIIPLMEVSGEVIGLKRWDLGLAEPGVGVEFFFVNQLKRGRREDSRKSRSFITTET